jgi:hypothetical protein
MRFDCKSWAKLVRLSDRTADIFLLPNKGEGDMASWLTGSNACMS